MADANFRRGLKRLPAHNLTFESWIYHPQIKLLTEVARDCPEVKIVLNHFGGPLGVGPYRRDEVFPTWRADIKALSRCPNVYVKLGGLAMIVNAFDFHLAPLPPSSGEMANAWQLPGRQRGVQLSCIVQRVQAPRLWRVGRGESRPVRRHRVAVLPSRNLTILAPRKAAADC
jgi:hypothetical protein